MKVYIVCEDYTGAFDDLFLDKSKAKKRAKEIGGYVLDYDLEVVAEEEKKEL